MTATPDANASASPASTPHAATPPTSIPHILILGGGFGGMWATRALATAKVRITLVDRTNHHLFQPLLYQVATAGLSATDIAAPLRHILRGQRNATVLLGEVHAIDPAARTVRAHSRSASCMRPFSAASRSSGPDAARW